VPKQSCLQNFGPKKATDDRNYGIKKIESTIKTKKS